MNSIFAAILPVAAIILVGAILRRTLIRSPEFWGEAEKLSYYLLFPALLVLAISSADFDAAALTPLVCIIVASTLLFSSLLLCFQWLLPMEIRFFTSVFQGGIRYSNYVFIAMTEMLYGAHAVSTYAVVTAYMVVLTNVLSVGVLTYYLPAKESPAKETIRRGALWWGIIRNPLIIACLIGLLLNFFEVALPEMGILFLSYFADAAMVMSLLCVGASLKFVWHKPHRVGILAVTGIKLVAMPIAVALMLDAYGITGMGRSIGLLYAAMPCASNAYILSRQLGGESVSMASIITLQTALSVITLPILLTWLA